MSGALHSAAHVEHYTPKPIIEAARRTLGGISLDPASCPFANRVVRATEIFTETTDGLMQEWFGPLFLNPPGKSKSNPGGSSVWWKKLSVEWSRGTASSRPWSAIFVGFSLEILQTAQSHDVLQPLDFATCVPKKRLQFDVHAGDLLERLIDEYEVEMDDKKHDKLEKRIVWLRQQIANGHDRVPGTSPTHGNIIVCLAYDKATSDRFMHEFSSIGHVRR